MTKHALTATEISNARRIDWAPYWAGAGIGVLTWVAFLVFAEPLGVTTELSRAASMVAQPIIGAQAVAENSYWHAMPLKWDFSVAFMVGMPLGAFLSAWLAGGLKVELVPDLWRARFGGSIAKRMLAAFLGGAIMMFGARLAGGCTSGHGLSGTMQMSVSSWLFLLVLALSASLASRVLFSKGQSHAR
jgi:uncharacterized protein